MAGPKLVGVKLLKNHGAVVTTVSTKTGRSERFVRPDGVLSTFEVAHLLRTYPNMVLRMVNTGRLRGRRSRGFKTLVPLASVRAFLRLGDSATSAPAPAAS